MLIQILIGFGALAALLVWAVIDGRRTGSQRLRRLPHDDGDTFIDEMVARAETENMKNAIRIIAEAQRDPWRGFDSPINEVSDHSDGVGRPAANVIAPHRSNGPSRQDNKPDTAGGAATQ
jgi:hypothetical protein